MYSSMLWYEASKLILSVRRTWTLKSTMQCYVCINWVKCSAMMYVCCKIFLCWPEDNRQRACCMANSKTQAKTRQILTIEIRGQHYSKKLLSGRAYNSKIFWIIHALWMLWAFLVIVTVNKICTEIYMYVLITYLFCL